MARSLIAECSDLKMTENSKKPSPDHNCRITRIPSPLYPSPGPTTALPGYPDFQSFLMASCRRKSLESQSEENPSFLLDLRTCPPLLRQSIMIACRKRKLEQDLEETKLDHVSGKSCQAPVSPFIPPPTRRVPGPSSQRCVLAREQTAQAQAKIDVEKEGVTEKANEEEEEKAAGIVKTLKNAESDNNTVF